ncbi:MAG: hypothetical protein Alpg2KO_03750 [Alphaproteobacteria bacterium]
MQGWFTTLPEIVQDILSMIGVAFVLGPIFWWFDWRERPQKRRVEQAEALASEASGLSRKQITEALADTWLKVARLQTSPDWLDKANHKKLLAELEKLSINAASLRIAQEYEGWIEDLDFGQVQQEVNALVFRCYRRCCKQVLPVDELAGIPADRLKQIKEIIEPTHKQNRGQGIGHHLRGRFLTPWFWIWCAATLALPFAIANLTMVWGTVPDFQTVMIGGSIIIGLGYLTISWFTFRTKKPY